MLENQWKHCQQWTQGVFSVVSITAVLFYIAASTASEYLMSSIDWDDMMHLDTPNLVS